MHSPSEIAEKVAALAARLPHLDWITSKLQAGRLSQDFSWFSPPLKRQLASKRADAVVRPRTEPEMIEVVAACAADDIPITVRGSGTGNYGQAVPLHGGIVLDMSSYNQPLWVKDGAARAQAGIRLADFEEFTRKEGGELRWLPSTFRSASLGGLFGGGFGGIGSIQYGPVASPGNILGAKILTIGAAPEIVELRGAQACLLHHTYGTTGIVLELEVALAPAVEWTEAVAQFDTFDQALAFADALAVSPGLAKREICLLSASAVAALSAFPEAFAEGKHAVLVLISPNSEEIVREILVKQGGVLSYRQDAQQVRESHRTLMELTWNHTTLNALKTDKSITYIQTAFDPACYLKQLHQLEGHFGDEVLTHLEFLRGADGRMTCSGIQLIRFTTEARLEEIMQTFRDHGVHINNPHVFVVEDGKQGKINPAVVAVKQRFDPQGLLNPGKLRGWDERFSDAVSKQDAAS